MSVLLLLSFPFSHSARGIKRGWKKVKVSFSHCATGEGVRTNVQVVMFEDLISLEIVVC
jgi:hypothetical protein